MNEDVAVGWTRARRSLHRLRTEGDTPVRQAVAFGLGAFIGCLPVFGLHLPLCLFAGWLCNVNRIKMYLASNVSNPFVAPFLLFGEVQLGHLLRTGAPYRLSLEVFRGASLSGFAADLVAGSVVVGAALGAIAAATTYALVRRLGTTPIVSRMVGAAVDRYVESGVFAWESANGKLRLDPVYRAVLREGLLPDAGVLVDLGCGRGLMLSLLLSARDCWQSGQWPADWPPPPTQLTLRGVELRPRMARDAARALRGEAIVEAGDARTCDVSSVTAVLLFDVLHMLPLEEQNRLLARVAGALEPGGVLIVREADAGGGWRARLIHAANWAKGLLEGDPGRRFHFRTADEWVARFEQLGLEARSYRLDDRRVLANVLFAARRPADDSP